MSKSSTNNNNNNNNNNNTIKCVVVGDGTVGKTCLLLTYSTNRFPTEYMPTVFDNYAVDLNISDRVYTLGLFDTAGQEGFEQLRPIAYTHTDVFLICYSVGLPSSLHNAEKIWVSEIKRHCPKTPYILVGTKIDIRSNAREIELMAKRKEKPVSYEEGARVAKKIKAVKYAECSALTQQGLKDVFDEAILAVFEKPKKNPSCSLL